MIILKTPIERKNFDIIEYDSMEEKPLKNRLWDKFNYLPYERRKKESILAQIEANFQSLPSPLLAIQALSLLVDVSATICIRHMEALLKPNILLANDQGEIYDLLAKYKLIEKKMESYPNNDAKRNPENFGLLLPKLWAGKTLDNLSWFHLVNAENYNLEKIFHDLKETICDKNFYKKFK